VLLLLLLLELEWLLLCCLQFVFRWWQRLYLELVRLFLLYYQVLP